MEIQKCLQEEFHLRKEQVENTIRLIDEGNTIPFIARYRKELTGSLDDQVLRELSERLTYLRGLEKRKEEVSALIDAQGKLTDELALAIAQANTMTEVDDLYRPYRPKRKTRASVAKEKGLEPLAELILRQDHRVDIEAEAKRFLTEEVPDTRSAVAGALDIIAEQISDDAALRKELRAHIMRYGKLSVKAADPETESVYTMYYDYSEPVSKIAGHRVLAVDRGEQEGFLKAGIEVEEGPVLRVIASHFVTGKGQTGELVAQACEDSYGE